MLLNYDAGEDSWNPLDSKEIKPVHRKGNKFWKFTGRTDAETEAPILWPPDEKNWLTAKDPDAGKDWRWEEKEMTEYETVGWHPQLDGHEFEQARSWWCHPTFSSFVVPFSSHLQSFPASESFPISQFFASGGQSIGVSASALVLPMNIQDWFPLGLISLISFQSKGLSRVFSNSTVQKHQFFHAHLSL